MDLFRVIQPLLFRVDPERAHALTIAAGAPLRFDSTVWRILARHFEAVPRGGPVSVGGLQAPNQIGLAAGCDKNGEAIDFFAALGFGIIEIGTVTRVPQRGNPRPRMFRLVSERAIINRLGFPSHGVEVVALRLAAYRERTANWRNRPLLGVNIGKNKDTPLDRAVDDYGELAQKLSPLVDYLVVNVSSPNTPELRTLQERGRLGGLLTSVKGCTSSACQVWVKISPDLDQEQLGDVVHAVRESGCDGIIATNTTLTRPGLSAPHAQETGGLSGAPLFDRALDVVREVVRLGAGQIPVMGVGGISTPAHVAAMLDAGACAVQLYTGLVYRGPGVVAELIGAARSRSDRHR